MKITPEIIDQHGLTPEEYQKILSILGREPNLVELGVFSVMWSEHCSYKSSKALLKKFPTKAPWVLQGPGENAGVIDIGEGLALAFKMESHNHPSFIEPYQGAATGVGGILRDVFTMGARPIANLDSLRFGAVNHPKTAHLVSGVVSGIAGYGNCMGIPTVGGETYFDECYNGNILVNAMTVGLLPANKIFKGFASGVGNPVFYVGSKTGRDGIHGATMASGSFDDESEQKKPTVQVGDPFTEKKLLEACLEIMEGTAVVGIQDMGAAGLTSSSFEMASRAGTGLKIFLDKVPLREEKMTPYEIMLSESQERMLLVCHKGREEEVLSVFKKWDLDVAEIGEVTNTGMYQAYFNDEVVVNVPIAPLADAAPVYHRPQKKPADFEANQKFSIKDFKPALSVQQAFEKMLAHPHFASKKWVYRQYDHQVMDNTVFIPGSDAAVLRIKESKKGIGITTNCNSRFVYLDPYLGGKHTIAESGRNLVCAGAKPLAITDCLNFGNPENPEIMWQLDQAITGLSEACSFLQTPVVSGNVSLYNETNGVSIYPTPTVGMVGILDDVTRATPSFFQNAGDTIILLGETFEELGGSEYLNIVENKVLGPIPQIDLEKEKTLWELMQALIYHPENLISSAHDISQGGLIMNLAESSVGSKNLGAEIFLESSFSPEAFLFGESASRIVITCPQSSLDQVRKMTKEKGFSTLTIGKVVKENCEITYNNKKVVSSRFSNLKKIWEEGFEKSVFSK